MKAPFFKTIVAIGLAVSIFTAFVDWLRLVFLLAWPSLALARIGIPYSFVISVIVLVGGIIWLGFWARSRPWKQVIIASAIIPFSYCVMTYYYPRCVSIPLPVTTPYDSTPEHRVTYLRAYGSGYLNAMIGNQRTHCFAPEDETRGYYDGQHQGVIIWYRMFGHTMTESEKQMIENSAAIDGVKPMRK